MTISRRALLALTAAATFASFTPAFAQDKGLVGISMPTKSSARWIGDGNSMVEQFTAAGYATDLQYAEDDIPNQLAQIENMITKGAKVLVMRPSTAPRCRTRSTMPPLRGSRSLPMTA